MPIYLYECKDGHRTEEYLRVADRTDSISCPSCGKEALISVAVRQYARTFKPYIENNFDGTPVEITSKHQRDELCKKHGLTYDSYKHTQVKKDDKSAVDDLDYSKVKHAIETGRDAEGLPIQGTVDPDESLD